jgi:hypothetical protein
MILSSAQADEGQDEHDDDDKPDKIDDGVHGDTSSLRLSNAPSSD